MDPGDTDPPYPPIQRQFEPTVTAERRIVLGDLIVLGQIRIEVIFPREKGTIGKVTVQGHSHPQGVGHRRRVQAWQRARQAETDGTGQAVGRRAEPGLAAAKDLGDRAELSVHFESDHRFVPEHRGGVGRGGQVVSSRIPVARILVTRILVTRIQRRHGASVRLRTMNPRSFSTNAARPSSRSSARGGASSWTLNGSR